MSSLKQLKLAQKSAVQQQQVVTELETLVNGIDRCEKTIITLKEELEAVNKKHQTRRTTQEDINYLTDLLKCANKKLGWEKQLASLQKRTPMILQRVTELMNDPKSPPTDEMRVGILQALQSVQQAMERLKSVKPD
jgi:hypothetical protein